MTPDRIALPVPPGGSAPSEAGDAYVASLDVVLTGPGGAPSPWTGPRSRD